MHLFEGRIHGFVVIVRTYLMLHSNLCSNFGGLMLCKRTVPPPSSLPRNILLPLLQWYSCHIVVLFQYFLVENHFMF